MSGYNSYDRHQIIQSGYKNYEKLLSKAEKGLRPFYRNHNFEKIARKREKSKKKNSWFNKKGKVGADKFSSVFFVPSTPGSELLRMLKETESKFQISPTSRVKFVETSGRKYIDQLQVKDPWSENCNPPQNCFVCKNATKQTNCKVANVGYSVVCETCRRKDVHKSYEGETCRNAHLRGKEHMRDILLKNEKSALYKHIKNDHAGEEETVEFRMNITGRFKSAMTRQIDEGIRIQNKPHETLLNSKSEFYGPAVKRKILEGQKK